MSGFFGIFNPKGTGIDRDAFERMRNSADQAGHDGIETYMNEHIAIGHVMLRVSPESNYDQQPLKSPCGSYILVGHFRLDYRDELGDKLGLTQTDLVKVSDSELVLKSYVKWGFKCKDQIEGDWCFVIYNFIESKIEIIKNKTGISACFYGKFNKCFFFVSDARFLLDIKMHEYVLNEKYYFDVTCNSGYPNESQTLIKDLLFVQNNEIVQVDSTLEHKKIIEKDRESNKILYKYEYDYELDFLSYYSFAVIERIKNVEWSGVFLSGGLDSTSLASLASLVSENTHRKIKTFTSIPLYLDKFEYSKNQIVDESNLVLQLSKKYRNLDFNFHAFPNANIEDDLNLYSQGNAYYPFLNQNSFWINGIIEENKKYGIKNIMTGQVGNYTITWSGRFYYVELLFSFQLKTFFLEMKEEISKSKKYYTTIKTIFLVPLFFYLNLIVKKIQDGMSMSVNPYLPILTKRDINKFQFYKKYYTKILMDTFTSPRRKKILIQKKVFTHTGIIWYTLSSRKYTIVSDPTNDTRLVFFLNQIPGNLYFTMLTQKYLFKRMLRIILPDEILKNNKSNIQSADFSYRLVNYLRYLDYDRLTDGRQKLNSTLGYENTKNDSQILDSSDIQLIGDEMNMYLKAISMFYFVDKLKSH
jgi:asparagine synthase (glutamine-hydrolysing)